MLVLTFSLVAILLIGNSRSEAVQLCSNCPLECFLLCVRVSNSSSSLSPCQVAKQNATDQCQQSDCVDFYCGQSSAIFCNDDGSLDKSCTAAASPLLMMQNDPKCSQWIESQCQGGKNDSEELTTPAEPIAAVVTTTTTAIQIPLSERCSGCPDECGELCALSEAFVAPCFTKADDSQCLKENCRNSYCEIPFAFYCTDDQKIDLNCTKDSTAFLFLNNSNDVCRNWLSDLCKKKPSPPMRPDQLTTGMAKHRVTVEPSVTTTPAEDDDDDDDKKSAPTDMPKLVCDRSCPDECGDLCLMGDRSAASPCQTTKQSSNDSQCSSAVCYDYFCLNPFAVFCNDDNQLNTECTSQNEASQMFLNSTSLLCKRWFTKQCRVRASSDSQPGIMQPYLKQTNNMDQPQQSTSRCSKHCPDACGKLCNVVNSLVAPCEVTPGQTTCPNQKCVDMYCGSPFAVFCTEDGQIDTNCSDAAAWDFVNSTNLECRQFIMEQCAVRKDIIVKSPIHLPDEQQQVLDEQDHHAVVKRSANNRQCLPDCPVECGQDLCTLAEAPTAPCLNYVDQTNNKTCGYRRCHNFYCRAPFAYYCNGDGTLDTNCTTDSHAKLFLEAQVNPVCTSWFRNQCKQFKDKEDGGSNGASRPPRAKLQYTVWVNVTPTPTTTTTTTLPPTTQAVTAFDEPEQVSDDGSSVEATTPKLH